MNYTFSLVFRTSIPVEGPATLLSGPDDTLILTPYANGTINGTTFAFVSSNITYPLFNYTLPNGSGWTQVVMQATEETTTASVNGTIVGSFEVIIRNSNIRSGMAFVTPVSSRYDLPGCVVTLNCSSRTSAESGFREISVISKCGMG